MLRAVNTALATWLFASALPIAAAAQVTPGTSLTGSLAATLDSKTAQNGQTFTLTSAHSPNHDINGATVYGHVQSVQRAGQGTRAKIELAWDKINARSGNVYRITAETTNVQVTTKNNGTKEAAAAGGGALVGGLIGGRLGAVAGGGGSYVYAKNSRQNTDIPQGSLVTLKVLTSGSPTR